MSGAMTKNGKSGRVVALLFSGFILCALTCPAGSAAADNPPLLSLPLDCAPENECATIKYVDHQPGPDMRDYACGAMTGGENDYPGTSIAIRDLRTMRRGVAVRAAADGVVLRRRDGVADDGVFGERSREEVSAQGCGNALVLDHGGGWTSVYCHLRRGSLTVEPGARVAAGDRIAEVGMSGLTELPHLHFQVRHKNRVVDPFVGGDGLRGDTKACGVGKSPLWRKEALAALTPYTPTLLRSAGFSRRELNMRDARSGEEEQARPACGPDWFFWVEIIGVRKNDRVALSVIAPDGRKIADGQSAAERDFAQMLPQIRIAKPGPDWPTGDYVGRARLTRDGRTFTKEARLTARPGC
jgi:hypothetical protein